MPSAFPNNAQKTMRVRSAVQISENTDLITQRFAQIVYTELSNRIFGWTICVWRVTALDFVDIASA